MDNQKYLSIGYKILVPISANITKAHRIPVNIITLRHPHLYHH